MELLIPNLIPPHQDESIYSYAYRLSRANGHTNLYAFLKSLQTGKEAADFHANWTYDGYRIFAPLLSKLEPETRATIIQNCSYYPFHAVFLTTHQQAIIVDRLFNNIKSKKSARKATIITQKNACKKCMEEDWENHGHYYMHPLPITKSPRRIGIVSQGIINNGSESCVRLKEDLLMVSGWTTANNLYHGKI